MVIKRINGKKRVVVVRKKTARPKMARAASKKSAPFSSVSTINTAPVAIGNSVKGSQTQVVQTGNGVVVMGRDFAYTPVGTGTITTWTLSGGTPLTPAAFSDSSLRQYMQMYQKFRWRRLIAHYITSSPTSANGDIMFYLAKNRNSVFLNQTSTQLLPFVMSDENTVIGPQWTNHSTELKLQSTWKSTDYGMSSVLDDFSEGDLFLLSKTSTTDSPGYIIFDFAVEFAQLQISPRLLALPLPRAQWSSVPLGGTITLNAGDSLSIPVSTASLGGGTSGVIPAGCTNGDIYKVIMDRTNSTTLPPGVTTLRSSEGGGYNSFTLTDGTTLYCVYNGTNFTFYPNAEGAFTGGNSLIEVNAGITAIAFVLQTWMSLVGTISSTNFNPNF